MAGGGGGGGGRASEASGRLTAFCIRRRRNAPFTCYHPVSFLSPEKLPEQSDAKNRVCGRCEELTKNGTAEKRERGETRLLFGISSCRAKQLLAVTSSSSPSPSRCGLWLLLDSVDWCCRTSVTFPPLLSDSKSWIFFKCLDFLISSLFFFLIAARSALMSVT